MITEASSRSPALRVRRIRSRLEMTGKYAGWLISGAYERMHAGLPVPGVYLDRIERALALGEALEDELAAAQALPVIVGRRIMTDSPAVTGEGGGE